MGRHINIFLISPEDLPSSYVLIRLVIDLILFIDLMADTRDDEPLPPLKITIRLIKFEYPYKFLYIF